MADFDLRTLVDGLGDLFSLLKHRGDIRDAAGRTIDAIHVAAQSSAVAARAADIAAGDIERAAGEARALKDLIVQATE